MRRRGYGKGFGIKDSRRGTPSAERNKSKLNRTRSMPTRKAKAQRFRNGSILLSDDSTAAHAKNKLYFGFRELGRVVRTIFLLR